MKVATILILSFISLSCFAQLELKCDQSGATYRQVIEVPGKSADELYKKVERWVATTYAAPDKATLSRLENELIRGQGFKADGVRLGALVYADMYYHWQVDVKDNKVRFTMSGMKTHQYSFETYVCKSDGSSRKNSQASNIKESFEQNAKALISSLDDSLNDREMSNDDW